MKNINSKSFKQYTANTNNKRSISPLLAAGTLNNHNNPTQSNSNPKSAKKKSSNTNNNNVISNSPYQRAIKQFQTYGNSKGQRKKLTNYKQHQQDINLRHNKFRIVTEPVDDRIMNLVQSNIFNSSLAIKNNKKIQTEIRENPQIRLNLRQNNSRSRDRIYSNTNHNNLNYQQDYQNSIQKSGQRSKSKQHLSSTGKCKNCIKMNEQLQYLNIQIKKIIKAKQLWKLSQITFQQIQQLFNNNSQMNDHTNVQDSPQKITKLPGKKYSSHNSLHNINKILPLHPYKNANPILLQIKQTISDLIYQIQSLSTIDYPKMLQMQIFKFEPSYNEYIQTQQIQLKQLFTQLRTSIQGKIIDYDTYDTYTQNHYTKMIMRNMKSRLNTCLRDNLQLKICKAIYQRSQEISDESQEYLRKVIEDVLENYVEKGKNKLEKQKDRDRDSGKQKEKDREKQKQKGKSSKR